MSTISTTMKRLKKGKEHRKAFVASQIKIGIPFQIRAMRKQRDWNQQQLAEAAGMLQPRIAAMEKMGRGGLNLKTLQRIADAFDVGLVVRFAPFSELVRWSDRFSPDEFAVPNFQSELEQINRAPNNVLSFNYLSTYTTQGTARTLERIAANYIHPDDNSSLMIANVDDAKTVAEYQELEAAGGRSW